MVQGLSYLTSPFLFMFPFVVSKKREIAKNAARARINTNVAKLICKREEKKKTPKEKHCQTFQRGAALCGDIGEINTTAADVHCECTPC